MNQVISNSDSKFIKTALESQPKPLRLDGRSAYDFRRLKIQIPAIGQSLVELGDTKVLTTVTAEIGTPYMDRNNEGSFFFNVDFGLFEANAQETSNEISKILERTLKESKAIDTESLCIISGEKVWLIRIDVLILDHSGNLIDACCLATLAALMHFRRPSISIQGENSVYLHSSKSKEPVPLSIHHTPIPTTFALFPHGVIIVDPTSKEEAVMEGKLTICVNTHREICLVQKSGGIELSASNLMKCIRIAAVKAEETSKFLKSCKVKEERTRSVSSVLDLNDPIEVQKKKKGSEKQEEEEPKDVSILKDFQEYSQRLENQELESLQQENQLAKEFLLNTFSDDFGFKAERNQGFEAEDAVVPDAMEEVVSTSEPAETLAEKKPVSKKTTPQPKQPQAIDISDDDDDLSVALNTKKKKTKKKPKKN